MSNDSFVQQGTATRRGPRRGMPPVRVLGGWLLGCLGVVALLMSLVPAATAGAAETDTFAAKFNGTFVITFGTGPNGTDELRFHGRGIGSHVGQASVEGYSQLRPLNDGSACSQIVADTVVITAADSSTLAVTDDARDCVEVTTDGRTLIHSSGSYLITGGTRRFIAASGSGAVTTEAIVTGPAPGGVQGTFDPLAFVGSLSP